jgi:hypothetical protein
LEKVFSIIKSRRAEVLMVVGFHAASLILMTQLFSLCLEEMQRIEGGATGPGNVPGMVIMGLSAGAMGFAVFWMMLFAGFLSTTAHYSETPAQPSELLRAGRSFFWRMFRFQLFFSIVHAMLMAAFLAAIAWLAGQKDPTNMQEWMTNLCSMAAGLVLIKVMLLGPAIIIVRNCRVREALAGLREYKLFDDGGWIVWLVLGCFFVVFLVSLVIDTGPNAGLAVGAVQAVLIGAVTLVVALAAVQLVAAKEIRTETETESLE